MPRQRAHLNQIQDVKPSKSFEPGEDWSWCYVDELFLELE
jgi:hypothetical protein